MAKIGVEIFQAATELCNAYNIDISFGYNGKGSVAHIASREIIIDTLHVNTKNKFWSIVFHELAHFYCWDNDIYYEYHADRLPKKEMAKYIRKMGLKAERFVDTMGEKLMKEYGFKMKYVKAYRSKEDVKWYKDWIEEHYPL